MAAQDAQNTRDAQEDRLAIAGEDELEQSPDRAPLMRGLAWSIGSVLLVLIVAWRVAGLARERALDDLRAVDLETMTLVLSNLRMELEKLEFVPQLVANDERIVRLISNPNDPEHVDIANRYLEEINRAIGASDTYVMDVTGLTLAASNWSSSNSFVGEDFGFRPYFQEALEGISGRYFARGATSHRRGYYFAHPIDHDGEILGVAAVKVGFRDIENTWGELPGPIVLTDWHGIVFATNQPAWRYRSLQRLDERTFEAVSQSRRYAGVRLDPEPLVEIEPVDGATSLMTVLDRAQSGSERPLDTTYLALSEVLPEHGWVVYTLSDLRTIADSVRSAAALGALSAALIALAAFYFAQRLHYRRQRERFEQRERRILVRNQEDLEQQIARRTKALTSANQQLQSEISEHQRAERALRETQRSLVQSAKLAALGQLAAGVTHELNQPLTALCSYADNTRLLIERGRLDEAGSNLERIKSLTDRMTSITRHLKTFTRKTEPDQRQVVDVVRTLEAALALVGVERASSDIALVHQHPAETLLTLGDPIRLEQVFVNLIKNGREALEDVEHRELLIDYQVSEGRIDVEIMDSGPGIARDDLNKVFDPFFTTKEVGAGLGLGLSISLGILNEMGGTLRAGNRPGGGAVFTVELQRAYPATQVQSA
jgi:two-component system C4-dicarboxylate transport sensor histidine kinase DctB